MTRSSPPPADSSPADSPIGEPAGEVELGAGGTSSATTSRAEQTRARLRAAARATVCEVGLAGTSARSIAAHAAVNQALIFYHFGTVAELLEAASDEAIEASIGHYRQAFDQVDTVDELLTVARALHAREQQVGNVAFMAQMLAGAQHDPVLARASRAAISRWSAEIQVVLDRVIASGPAAGLIDSPGLAHLVSAGFIGLELSGGIDDEAAATALDTLESLGALVDVVNGLGPVARRAFQAKLRRRR